ncbi:uncharacterized protein B0H18DRAFT_1114111 [Fomitopsis serialis]|uniref:uncharacterized protein n=1 Tax=Fomitopsis serialis TaxID=139415 RepID=UPI0020076798|nr:uncharacterized protein B0H18DRAFT_1114111 [Neoantrodia serialis]KAH9935352.1 hypothetical protein B0H18DRAFT_1114111 [Neoantrodia serialis]
MLGDDYDDFLDDEDFSWEATSSSPGNTPGLCGSSMHELAAAFPSPPKTAPEFPLSLSALDRDAPPDLPLPPTPPFLRTARSPHVYANGGLGDNRMTTFDPEESMARLEYAYFFDDDEEDMEDMEDSEGSGRDLVKKCC